MCYIVLRSPKSQRREDLLDAIIEYMLKNGVADLSLRPLAKAVGSKARLLVYHFGSKDALITEAMIVVRDRVQQAFADMVDNGRGRTPSDIMHAFWQWTTTKQNESYLRLFFEVQGLALQKPRHYGRYLEGALTTWMEMMSNVLPPELPRAQRRALATLALSTVVGLLLDYLSSGDKKRPADALDFFAAGFDALLKKACAAQKESA
jgi:AcrR family transcriptional regulator